jgi:flagellar hook assembly protein FlgD
VPKGFNLFQNYPNPFNPITTISYGLPEDNFVTLSIYNLQGQLVETLVSEFKNTGQHTVEWNAGQLNSGVFLYKIQSAGMTKVKKCILLK